jgi:hypothetical protein
MGLGAKTNSIKWTHSNDLFKSEFMLKLTEKR